MQKDSWGILAVIMLRLLVLTAWLFWELLYHSQKVSLRQLHLLQIWRLFPDISCSEVREVGGSEFDEQNTRVRDAPGEEEARR